MKEKALKELNKVFKKTDNEIIKRFLGGMSNYTYLAKVGNDSYVIRVVDELLNVFVDRQDELDHLKNIKPLKISNELITFDRESGVKISKYIPGVTLVEDMSFSDVEKVAKTLKRLHSSKTTGHHYGFFKRIKKYEDLLDTNEISIEYTNKLNWWIKTYQNYFRKFEEVFIHGDAQRSNILKGEDENIYLLDFEFSGMADPYYDIASFGNINFDDSLKLLDYYLDNKTTKMDIVRVKFYRIYQVLQWYLVATFKEKNGYSEKLHIDFRKYAKNYLKLANKLYEEIKDVDLNDW